MTFRPVLWMTVFALAGLAVLIMLGSWQLNRMAWKTGLLERLLAQMGAPAQPADLSGLLSDGTACADIRFTAVRIAGTWTGAPVYVYAVREAKPAHHIFRSLLQPDGTAIAIDTGYVPYDRHDLVPTVPAGQEDSSLAGILRCPQKPGLFTPAADLENRLWYTADVPALAPVLAAGTTARFYDGAYIQLVKPGGSALVWPRTRSPADMLAGIPNNHFGYALTWFGLAAALVAVYIGFHISQGRLRFG